MEDRVSQRQLLDLVFGNDLVKLLLNVLPFILAPEIVEKNKTAAHDVLAQPRRLFVGEFHEARLDDVEDRVVEDAIVEYFERFGSWGNLQVGAGPFTQADNEVVVC